MVVAQDTNMLAAVVAMVVCGPASVGRMILLNNLCMYSKGTDGPVTVPGGCQLAPRDAHMPTTLAIVACLARHNMDIIIEQDMHVHHGGSPVQAGNPAEQRVEQARRHGAVVDRHMAELGLCWSGVWGGSVPANELLARWGVTLAPARLASVVRLVPVEQVPYLPRVETLAQAVQAPGGSVVQSSDEGNTR